MATNVDVIPNIIEDGKNGLLVEKDDYINVAQEVVELFTNFKINIEYVNNAIKDSKKYSGKRLVASTNRLYANTIL